MILAQLDHERKQCSALFEENLELKAQVEQLKFELKIERQTKFAILASDQEEQQWHPAD